MIPVQNRISLTKIHDTMEMPNLVEIQVRSYEEFLQTDRSQRRRKRQGLEAVFQDCFPIESFDGSCRLDYDSYSLGLPKYSIPECHKRGMTYAAPLKVKIRLLRGSVVKEQEVYIGDLPLMTEVGTFIINGIERVVVTQIIRSFGVLFTADEVPNWSAISNGATSYTRDTTAPSAIANFVAVTGSGVGELNLTWTAPGDDGAVHNIVGGTFRIYYSSVSGDMSGLTATTSPAGTLARVDIATSATAGSAQGYTLGSLITDGTTYYARIFTADEVPNWSSISNGATSYTRDTTAPSAVANFAATTGAGAGELNLTWTAPGDDGAIHNIGGGTFRIYYSSVSGDMSGLTATTSPAGRARP